MRRYPRWRWRPRAPQRRPWATYYGYHGECAKCGLETGNPKRDLDLDGLCKFCRPEA